MLLNQLRYVQSCLISKRCYSFHTPLFQTVQHKEVEKELKEVTNTPIASSGANKIPGELFPAARVVPMVLTNKEPVVLSFDDVPGPKSLKYLSSFRHYLSQLGTQFTASVLTIGLNLSTYINTRKPLKNLSALFDEYGPVVRFISPVGNDIVLINHPDHIQKVYTMEGDCPVRSALDSLEKYRMEHRQNVLGGLFTVQGEHWCRQREIVHTPLHNSIAHHINGVCEICDNFTQKVYNMRNYQDEVPKDLYDALHKWAFDCMGLILFAKKFTMLDTELVYSQCDMSWMYHSLQRATDAIVKCESGLHWWKIFSTPAWHSLVKYCDSLDNLIGKHVLEAEQALTFKLKDNEENITTSNILINSMLVGQEKMNPEDIATVIMDMLLIGVNTITSSMSFLLYYLAKYQRAQKLLYQEVVQLDSHLDSEHLTKIREQTPYLQACLKETLRLVPPIPVLTRILPKNITLDRYNIPRGTLIIMSTQDTALKESNYDDAAMFYPERWLKPEAKDYHAFASIPFGFGARKCLGQNIAETLLSLLTVKIVQKYKLEYHYGDIQPTRSFIAKPNKSLKIRFIDRN
ncbi:hypothetical protein O3G_MSEX002354 [Manduca sexta]|uniref:Cytochrome P450 n=1 Tax=Manduca sexta TaxID=7130 RepID=A0A921YNG3_MANSE|nr:hypothetical protein O3G_MSEX002354 [Manduca sexta]KAG6442479.1 hypothetical protein O3G_MSEX002354 [Manduca sexta]